MGFPCYQLFSPLAHINYVEVRYDIPGLPRCFGVAKGTSNDLKQRSNYILE